MEDGITFGCFLVSLFSSSLLFGSRPGTNGVGTGFYHLPMEVEFPRAPDPPKGRPELYRSVVGLMGSYDCVRRMIVSFFVSLSFSSLVRFMQPRRSAPKERDNVTAARDPGPGNGHSI